MLALLGTRRCSRTVLCPELDPDLASVVLFLIQRPDGQV